MTLQSSTDHGAGSRPNYLWQYIFGVTLNFISFAFYIYHDKRCRSYFYKYTTKYSLGNYKEFYRLIALLVIFVLISTALIFFFNSYDLILFLFLILISNFIFIFNLIKAKNRELLKLLLSGGNVCLSVLGGLTIVEDPENISDILNNISTDSGNSSDDVEHLTDHMVSDSDEPANSSVIKRTDKIFSLDPIEENVTPSSSASELISSKEVNRRPLETIVEVDEENYNEEEDYDADIEGNYDTDSELGSKVSQFFQLPAPDSDSAATSSGPGYFSRGIEIEGPFYSSDDEQVPKPPSDAHTHNDIEIEGPFYSSGDEQVPKPPSNVDEDLSNML